jgi:hypothetical protein
MAQRHTPNPARNTEKLGGGFTLVLQFELAEQRWAAWAEDGDGSRFTTPLHCLPDGDVDQLMRDARDRAWRCRSFISPAD